MDFFKNKLNIVLTFVLCAVIGAGGVLAYKMLLVDDKTIVPDFADKYQNDVESWCNSFEANPCIISSDYSETVEKGKVIYQSVSADSELVDKISFIISLGKEVVIEIPVIDENTTKDKITEWANNNNITNISYVEEYSDDIEQGIVIKIEPNSDITIDSNVVVYISKGKKEVVEDNSTITVTASKYVGLSESEFKTKVEALGLTPSYASSRDDYSSTIEKGKIVWHGSGEYVKDEEIHYGLSLGNDESVIKVEQGTYVGKSLEDFKSAVSKLGTKGLVVEHNSEWDDYSNTIEKGYIVRHGYGNYVDEENIRYGLSLGKKDEDDSEIIIKEGEFVDYTYDDFAKKIKEYGLVPYHKSSLDVSTSDDDKVGKISKNGYGTYEKGENCSYGLYVSNSSSTIVINKGDYVGKTYADFEAAVAAKGLGTSHRSDWDQTTNDSSLVGKVCKNGNGEYVKGENCSYGLYISDSSSSTSINITANTYIGYLRADFKSKMSELGLDSDHNTDWDAYSDTVDEGKVIKYETGSFNKGDTVEYGLSLGKNTSAQTIEIAAGTYNNKSVDQIEAAIKALGLVPNHNASNDAYGKIAKGNVVYHDSGSFTAGASVNYGLSLGEQSLYINTKSFYNTNYMFDTYADMEAKMKTVLAGFSNVTYVKTQSADVAVGKISYIKINGSSSYDPGYISASTPIEIGIVNSLKAS